MIVRVNFIFPNCNYLIVFGGSAATLSSLERAAERFQIRLLTCQAMEDFQVAVSVIRRPLGVLLTSNSAESQSARSFSEAAKLMCWILNADADPEIVLGEIVQSLTPKGLGQLMTFSASLVFPRLVANIGSFTEVAEITSVCDRQVNFTTTADGLIGFCSTKVNLGELLGTVRQTDVAKAMGSVIEATNQFLGVVSGHLNNFGFNVKIGMPTTFDLSKTSNVETLMYFPFVHVADARGVIIVSLGYSRIDDQPMFDLSNINLDVSEEVEFL